jgi:hypothetical protein
LREPANKKRHVEDLEVPFMVCLNRDLRLAGRVVHGWLDEFPSVAIIAWLLEN